MINEQQYHDALRRIFRVIRGQLGGDPARIGLHQMTEPSLMAVTPCFETG